MANEPERVTLIVDGANVMGSRADGWWRDRAGAMARLHGELAVLAARGIRGNPLQPGDGDSAGDGQSEPAGAAAAMDVRSGRWVPEIILVVEGQAKAVTGTVKPAPRIRVVAAPSSGDDEIAALAASVPGHRFAVTADRELARRCRAAGAGVLGPRWLTRLFS